MASIASDPLESNYEMARYAKTLGNQIKNGFGLAERLFESVTDGGELQITYSYSSIVPREHGTKTALDVWKSRSGDCDEMTWLYNRLATFAKGEGGRGIVKVGYADVDIDKNGEEVGHWCAAVFIRGKPDEAQEGYCYKDFEKNKEYRRSVLKTMGIKDSNDLHMVLVDLTYNTFGIQHKKVDVLNENEARASYYLNAGLGFQNTGRSNMAMQAYDKALDYAKGSERFEVYNAEVESYGVRDMNFRAFGKTLVGIGSAIAARGEEKKYEQKVKPKITLSEQTSRILASVKAHRNRAPRDVDGAADVMDAGIDKLNAGKLKEALECFKAVLLFDPNIVPANFFAGIVYLREGNYEKAEEHFKRVIEIDPNHADGHYWLGVAHLKSGEYRDAFADFKKTLAIEKDYPYAKYNLMIARAKSDVGSVFGTDRSKSQLVGIGSR